MHPTAVADASTTMFVSASSLGCTNIVASRKALLTVSKALSASSSHSRAVVFALSFSFNGWRTIAMFGTNLW